MKDKPFKTGFLAGVLVMIGAQAVGWFIQSPNVADASALRNGGCNHSGGHRIGWCDMALCPGARSDHTSVVTDPFADRKLSGVSTNAKDSRANRSLATDVASEMTPTDAGLLEGSTTEARWTSLGRHGHEPYRA